MAHPAAHSQASRRHHSKSPCRRVGEAARLDGEMLSRPNCRAGSADDAACSAAVPWAAGKDDIAFTPRPVPGSEPEGGRGTAES